MGGSLSQDEIDALLNTGSSPAPTAEAEPEAAVSSDSAVPSNNEEFVSKASGFELEGYLNNDQKDALGEIGNISMGTSATTLSTLLNQKVLITTPKVSVVNWNDLAASYDRPCVGIRVNYKEGIEGSNVLVLRQKDVKIIADLMMAGSGEVDDDFELTEIDLSAIQEAMNQMVGSSSTSLSQMLDIKIDIDTPQAFILSFKDDSIDKMGFTGEVVACTAFRMQIGDLIDSEIMQILPVNFAVDMINKMMGGGGSAAANTAPEPEPVSESNALSDEEISKLIEGGTVEMPKMETVLNQPQAAQAYQQAYQQPQQPYPYPPQQGQPYPYPPQQGQQPQQPYPYPPQQGQPYPYPYPPYPYPQQQTQQQNVSPVTFPEFTAEDIIQQKKNIDIIQNVPLEITVELGRTHKLIREILDFSPGTIIELDKIAGEPIDILVNGKYIAKGEVVVIDENFGIRITDIINSEDRI